MKKQKRWRFTCEVLLFLLVVISRLAVNPTGGRLTSVQAWIRPVMRIISGDLDRKQEKEKKRREEEKKKNKRK